MTNNEIVTMAKEAGISTASAWNWITHLKNFAELISAKEREACAKVCDFEVCGSQGFAGPTCCILPPEHDGAHKYGVPMAKTQMECAAAIRMRSNVKVTGALPTDATKGDEA